MAGTNVQYGAITFTNGDTRALESTLVVEEGQVFGRKFRVVVQGYLHLEEITIHGIQGQGNAEDIPGNYVWLEAALMQRRQTLVVTVDGDEMLRSEPSTAAPSKNADINNGPTPVAFRVLKITGDKLLHCEFEIETTKHPCTSDNPPSVVSNRWEMEDVIDQNWYTTRTWRGRLKVASVNAGGDLGVHTFRSWVLPALNSGFLRKRVRVGSSMDGLTLTYEVTDEQTSHAPPPPATTWSGRNTLEVTRGTEGAGRTMTCQVKLSGPEGGASMRRKLLALTARVLADRLKFQAGRGQLVRYSLSEELSTNTVEGMAVVFVPGELTSGVALLGSTTIGTELFFSSGSSGYNRLRGMAPGDFGTATAAGLLAAALQEPCSPLEVPRNATTLTDSDAANRGVQAGIQIKTFEVDESFIQTIDTNPYADAHTAESGGFYPLYEIDVQHVINKGRVDMPLALSSSDSGDTVAVIPLHKPTCRRIVSIEGSRMRKAPDVPKDTDYEHGGIKYRTLKYEMLNSPPKKTADGESSVFYSRLTMTQSMSRPPKEDEPFDIASLPWDKTQMDDNTLKPEAFKTGIATR